MHTRQESHHTQTPFLNKPQLLSQPSTSIAQPKEPILPAIDIHYNAHRLPIELDKLDLDSRILEANRATIREYITLASKGRLKKRGRTMPTSTGRCLKLLTILKRYGMCITVPFVEVHADDLEDFIMGIEDGSVHKLIMTRGTNTYSHETARDFKKIIRTFYKWLLRDQPELIDELVGWFETKRVVTKPKALDPRAIPHLARAIGSIQGDAMVWSLFDGGFRIGELLNVRLGRDVMIRTTPEGVRICEIEIRVSKTFGRTIVLPLASDSLLFWIERHPHCLGIDHTGRVLVDTPGAFLFQWSYRYCCRMFRELGLRELNEVIHPHRFRHTSASYWASKLKRHQLCARMGWSLSSPQPDRYIKRDGYFTEQINKEVIKQSSGDVHGDFARPGISAIPLEHVDWH